MNYTKIHLLFIVLFYLLGASLYHPINKTLMAFKQGNNVIKYTNKTNAINDEIEYLKRLKNYAPIDMTKSEKLKVIKWKIRNRKLKQKEI